jgi:hypothetical protein
MDRCANSGRCVGHENRESLLMRSTPICKSQSCYLALAFLVLGCSEDSPLVHRSSDGAPITLDEFSAGDYVDVKGFPLDGDSLKNCQMAQTAP